MQQSIFSKALSTKLQINHYPLKTFSHPGLSCSLMLSATLPHMWLLCANALLPSVFFLNYLNKFARSLYNRYRGLWSIHEKLVAQNDLLFRIKHLGKNLVRMKSRNIYSKTICHPYESIRAKVKTHNTMRQYAKRYKYLTHKYFRYKESIRTECSLSFLIFKTRRYFCKA